MHMVNMPGEKFTSDWQHYLAGSGAVQFRHEDFHLFTEPKDQNL